MNIEMRNRQKKTLVLRMAEFFFAVYMVTDYLFMSDKSALIYTYVAFILFAGFTMLHILERKRMYFGKSFMLAYLTCSWIFASFFWATNQRLALINIKTMWQIFLLFYLVYNLFYENKDAYKKYISAMYIGGIAFVVYTVYAYGVSDLIKTMLSTKAQRLGGDISQANVYGMNHATTTLIAFYYMMYRKRHKLFHFAIMCSSFICAMSSGSKKALLIAIIGILYLVYKMYGVRQLYKIVGVTLFAGILFYIAIQMPMFEMVRRRFEESINALLGQSGGDGSTRARLKFIGTGWRLFKEKMLIGHGVNNFRYVSGYRMYSHNNFIEILVGIGLIGFLLYYSMYLSAFNNINKEKSSEGRLLLVILVVRTVLEMAMVTYYDKKLWIMLAFLLLPVGRLKKPSESGITSNEGDE